MSSVRFKAIGEVLNRKSLEVKLPSVKTSEYLGINVFDSRKMQEYLSGEAYKKVMDSFHWVSE